MNRMKIKRSRSLQRNSSRFKRLNTGTKVVVVIEEGESWNLTFQRTGSRSWENNSRVSRSQVTEIKAWVMGSQILQRVLAAMPHLPIPTQMERKWAILTNTTPKPALLKRRDAWRTFQQIRLRSITKTTQTAKSAKITKGTNPRRMRVHKKQARKWRTINRKCKSDIALLFKEKIWFLID